MKKMYHKWLIVFGTLGVLALLIYIFEINALRYVCDKENNNSACFLLYQKLKDESPQEANEYLSRSCSLGYELACKELKK
ncbi:hypothetical protein M899_2698 [Bacteriovorax sp. BSW11_IV]|uniref:hypothetical protein n=1 Tax=Bacteriovorax sp. BSW11_IV TaxID=1353529 RepID=UPI000389E1AA|nr:hypothetical protein [Bacteriovorax sp. BSW11_IV]EQC49084.1 hypothetical protein M899_2698 [Bacteriovorax sp. BSW11_IV]